MKSIIKFICLTTLILLCLGSNPIQRNAFAIAKIVYEKSKREQLTNKHYIVIIDFTKPDTEPRLYIVNEDTNAVIYSTYVAHGIGSGAGIYTTSFSNVPNSKATSIGVYKTTSFYNGRHGLSLKVVGLESGYNNNAYNRAIEIHTSNYIGITNPGHSWGCFAIPTRDAYLIKYINTDTIIVAYYPNSDWLHNSRFLNG